MNVAIFNCPKYRKKPLEHQVHRKKNKEKRNHVPFHFVRVVFCFILTTTSTKRMRNCIRYSASFSFSFFAHDKFCAKLFIDFLRCYVFTFSNLHIRKKVYNRLEKSNILVYFTGCRSKSSLASVDVQTPGVVYVSTGMLFTSEYLFFLSFPKTQKWTRTSKRSNQVVIIFMKSTVIFL